MEKKNKDYDIALLILSSGIFFLPFLLLSFPKAWRENHYSKMYFFVFLHCLIFIFKWTNVRGAIFQRWPLVHTESNENGFKDL